MPRHSALAASLLAAILLVACGGGNSAAGTYALDTAPLKKTMLDAADQAGDPGARKMVEETADAMLGKMRIELTLKADGTFTVSGEMGQPMNASGTYTITGEQIKMVTTEENGKPKASPEEKTGTIKDGVITVAEDGMSMTLRKK